MAYFSQNGATQNSLTITVYTKYQGGVTWRLNGSIYSQTSSSYNGSDYSSTQTFSGLSAGTGYSISATIVDNWSSGTESASGTYWTLSAPPNPEPSPLTGLRVLSATATEITLIWNSSSNATRYYWNIGGVASGFTSSIVATASGLTPNTSYLAYVVPYNVNTSGTGDQIVASTLPNTVAPSAPTATRIYGGFNVSWGSVPNASYYEFEYKDSSSSTWTTTATVNTFINGFYPSGQLMFGYSYNFRVRARLNNATYTDYSAISTATTAPETVSISLNASGSSATVFVSLPRGKFSYIEVELLTIGGSLIDSKTTTSASGSVSWTNLTIGQKYQFRARAAIVVTGGTVYSLSYSNVIIYGGRPQDFSWNTAKIKGNNFNVTAVEWNALTTRINEFRQYQGLSNFSFTFAGSGNTFLASIFSQAVNAISSMSKTISPPSLKSSGNDILASDLNLLVSSLNSVI